MTRRRWIADEVSPDGMRASLLGDNAAHLARVLRARVGQQFDIALPDGTVRLGAIAAINEWRADFTLGETVQQEQVRPLTLLLAIFKFDRFEWAVEKSTELGVQNIVPVIARRSDAHLVKAAGKRVERWQRIAREAAQQSRRSSTPDIGAPMKLEDALATAADLRVVLSEYESERSLLDLAQHSAAGSHIALAIGPEGGWTSDELETFQAAGWRSASLGATILRAETAALAALAISAAPWPKPALSRNEPSS